MKNPLERARECARVLKEAGHECYMVGGCVRDELMGIEPKDVDLTTNAMPLETQTVFKEAGYRVVDLGIIYGTVAIVFPEGNVEITTYRLDGTYFDGRHPDSVEFARDIRGDLSRRDFTVNAIAKDPLTGEIVDPYDGRGAIKCKVLCSVGKPADRFAEDGLRIMRACRFASKLGFAIEKETLEAMRKNYNMLGFVSPERFRDELMKLLAGRDVMLGIHYLEESGIMNNFLHDIACLRGLRQRRKYHRYDAYEHSIKTVEAVPQEKPLVRFAALFHDTGKYTTAELIEGTDEHRFHGHEKESARIVKNFMTDYRFSNDEIEKVVTIVREHMVKYDDQWSWGGVRRFANRVTDEHLEDLYVLRAADVKAHLADDDDDRLDNLRKLYDRIGELRVKNGSAEFSVKDLAIDGNDVMEVLGIEPGPKVGKVLKTLFEKVLEDMSLNERETLLEMVKR